MTPILQDHLPLITPRIRFHPYHARPLPTITPRLRYDDLLQGRRRYEDKVRIREHGGRIETSEDDDHGGGSIAGTRGIPDRMTPSSSHDEESEIEIDPYYAKPGGQPNRPRSGGYSMKEQLVDRRNWTLETLKSVSDRVAALAKTMIDTRNNYRTNVAQKNQAIDDICKQVAEEYPALELHLFKDDWVVRDMLKLALQSKPRRR
ncbi:hypothetical protein IW262DRAFT_1014100 [Armillaria fumosa]|nr:hypothetical protein IW262DRAFT_1014100 [Armillaria fumosa]